MRKLFFIKSRLINVWDQHNFVNDKWVKVTIRQKLTVLFLCSWYSDIENSSKSTFYRLFKTSFGQEKKKSLPSAFIYSMVRFRTRNHRLPVEIGNWERIPQ